MSQFTPTQLARLYRRYVKRHWRREFREFLYSDGTNKANGILMTPSEHRKVHHNK